MSAAVKAVRYLLANNAPLTAQVPATDIVAGTLVQGTSAPAISVQHVSTTRRKTVAPGAMTLCISRVQVNVVASTYPELVSVLALVRTGLPRSRGTVNGVKVDALLLDSEGPHAMDEEMRAYVGSQDVIVKHLE